MREGTEVGVGMRERRVWKEKKEKGMGMRNRKRYGKEH